MTFHLCVFSGDTSQVRSDSEDSDEAITDARVSFYQNLDAVDIDSEDFKALPIEIQHEILLELKDRLRHRSWTKRGNLPDVSCFTFSLRLIKYKILKNNLVYVVSI